MRKIIILLGFMAMVTLPLISYAAIQPDTATTWVGGVVGAVPTRIENMTLSEISERAMREAGLSGGFVKYSTEDSGVVMVVISVVLFSLIVTDFGFACGGWGSSGGPTPPWGPGWGGHHGWF